MAAGLLSFSYTPCGIGNDTLQCTSRALLLQILSRRVRIIRESVVLIVARIYVDNIVLAELFLLYGLDTA